MREYYTKSVRITVITFLVYGLLVATHLGEFWPFSIYPMFSQAGKPWKRAVVRDVTDIPPYSLWHPTNIENLPGAPIPLDDLNVNTNDVANYLSKTEVWTEGKIRGVRKLFADEIKDDRAYLLLQARGALTEQDTVKIEFIPFIYLAKDTTILNSELKTEREHNVFLGTTF